MLKRGSEHLEFEPLKTPKKKHPTRLDCESGSRSSLGSVDHLHMFGTLVILGEVSMRIWAA